jgi:HlyD family secretion protein
LVDTLGGPVHCRVYRGFFRLGRNDAVTFQGLLTPQLQDTARIAPMRKSFFQHWFHIATCAALVVSIGCDRVGTRGVTGATQTRPRQIYALGQLEPASGIISVSAIPGERLMQLDPDVAVNKREPANGVLGLLASYSLGKAQLSALIKKKELAEKNRQQQMAVALAQKKQAEATLAQAQAKLKELELQSGKLQALRVTSQLAFDDYARLDSLRAEDPGLITEHQLKRRENEMATALADFQIANEGYASAKEAAEKTVAAAEANIEVADLTLRQLAQKLEEQGVTQEIAIAKETLKRSILLSPSVSSEAVENVLDVQLVADHRAGSDDERGPLTVLKIFLRPGEFVTQMPIMQLGDLSKMVCVAEVYEADVKNLHIGQAAMIRSPAFAGQFADGLDVDTNSRTGGMQGKIERIGNVIGSPGLANRNPLAPADRSVVEVRVVIEDPAAVAEAAQRVGLQVTVEFALAESTMNSPAEMEADTTDANQ